MVFSQPFLRQRQAVHGVMPTFSIHFERLMTAVPGFECVLSFNISLRNDILRLAVVKRCITYTFGQAFFLYDECLDAPLLFFVARAGFRLVRSAETEKGSVYRNINVFGESLDHLENL